MPILGVLGDLHGHRRHLEQVVRVLGDEAPDAVLLVGDFASHRWEREFRGGPDEARELEREVHDLLAPVRALGVPLAWVPGNHDLRGLSGEGAIDRRCVQVAGLRVHGIGGAGPARFGFPYEWGEREIQCLEVGPCEVLLTHTPPRGTLDRTVAGVHVGSRAIQSHATRAEVVVCGHIHEAAGVARLGDALCLNAGSLGEPFPRPQYGVVRFGDEDVEAELVTLDDGKRRTLRRPRRRGTAPAI